MKKLHINRFGRYVMGDEKQYCIPQSDVAFVQHVFINIKNGAAITADG